MGIDLYLAAAFQNHRNGHLAEAERLYRHIVAVDPRCADAWYYLGTLVHQQGNFPFAAECYDHAAHLKPDDPALLNNWGNALRDLDHLDAAIGCYSRALELAPNIAEIHNNLGVALRDRKALEEAVASFRRALELKPDYFEALNNLGNALKDLERLGDAIACYARAAELEPTSALVQDNLGLAYLDLGRVAEAEACFERSLKLDPAAPHARWSHSLLLLLKGDWERGWAEHEWRWHCPDWRRATRSGPPNPFPQPIWNGESTGGQTVLLRAEQGLGDTLQFVRYVALVKDRGCRVALECQPSLMPLLRTCGADELAPEGGPRPAFVARRALLSLPELFHTTTTTVPAGVPYLHAEASLVAHWRQRLEPVRGYRIGINWRGRQEAGIHRQRDVPLAHFARLANIPGVQLISLQHGVAHRNLAEMGMELPILQLGEDVDGAGGAFMDTAAIMKNLDLVITSDTAVAHLAGALGARVWTALPYAADWRWLLHRSDTPWYPTMRLFRQPAPADWTAVFDEIAGALAAAVEHSLK